MWQDESAMTQKDHSPPQGLSQLHALLDGRSSRYSWVIGLRRVPHRASNESLHGRDRPRAGVCGRQRYGALMADLERHHRLWGHSGGTGEGVPSPASYSTPE